ncbi:MAG: hypothetical protein K2X45_15835 [Phreatobacter sp.]|nr:hypothetical protein [Phreatobacter sp.]
MSNTEGHATVESPADAGAAQKSGETAKGKTRKNSLTELVTKSPAELRADLAGSIEKAITVTDKKTGEVRKLPSYQLHVQQKELQAAFNTIVHGGSLGSLQSTKEQNAQVVRVLVELKDAISQPAATKVNGKSGVDMNNRLAGKDGIFDLMNPSTFGRVKVAGQDVYHSRALHFDPEKLQKLFKTIYKDDPTALQTLYRNFRKVQSLSIQRNDKERERRVAAKEGKAQKEAAAPSL